jgi:protein-tyrosine phosphatase
MAEVVLRSGLEFAGLRDLVALDSAGTGDWHIGQRMNTGARAALARRGYDGSAHRARQFSPSWLETRDLVLAMDHLNLSDLRRMGGAPARVRLFGEVGGFGGDVPDPYGGTPADFDHVLDLLESAAPVVSSRLGELLLPRLA